MASKRLFITVGFLDGADIQVNNRRDPALVSVLSIVASNAPYFETPIVLIISRLLRVAPSISRTSLALHFCGNDNFGIFPCCVSSIYSTRAPAADISALEKVPKESRDVTP